ncbi:hypothetical protein NL676_025017 [Syzygium grande]|nr:hypothetical protein NL676_025017 [Syzygium grande]
MFCLWWRGLARNVSLYMLSPALVIRRAQFQNQSVKYISLGVKASGALQELGLEFPFDCKEGSLMEMVKPVEERNLFVLHIFHKCFIEVNKRGAEAAAASADHSTLGAACFSVITKVDFVADHPFLFLIMEKESSTVRFLSLILILLLRDHVALSLSKHLLLTWAKDSNLVFSPLSIHVVLSLIAAGSTGPTQDQLLSFLRAKSTDDLHYLASQLVAVVLADSSAVGGPKLSFVNGVWIDKSLPLRPSFKQVVDASYKAATNLADFKTKVVKVTSEVNTWAKKETSGLIKEVLPAGSVDGTTRLIFANARYFKDARDGLLALVEKVSSESSFLDCHLPHKQVEVGEFRIPRFKISFGFENSKYLKTLGLVLLFSGEGGLTEMVDSPEG